jgi:tRNA modification GTPase
MVEALLLKVFICMALLAAGATLRRVVRAARPSIHHQNLRRTTVSMAAAATAAATSDTIFALSAGPLTKTGVAVVRISGPAARLCLEELTLSGRPASPARKPQAFPEARRASLRYLYCPRTRDVLDHALVLWFPGPRSFTGEDIVELHCHGGRAVILGVFGALEQLDDTLAATLRQQGAGDDGSSGGARRGGIRPADRGEFTRRAFENGRMDLTEVEGLSDLLAADTSEQRKQALRQMDGYLRQFFERWREELLGCLAHTEAVIDFGDDDREDDVNDGAMYALIPRVHALREELLVHLQDGRRGELVRDGVKIALAGPPNAGKSSLMNALARRPAAIVSPIAGTTRDIVEVRMDLGGIPCIISDTAGLRAGSDDPIEVEGMRRARTGVRV